MRSIRRFAVGIAFSGVIAFTITASVFANYGSNIDHPCDATTASQCTANNYFQQVFIDGSVNGRQLTATTWGISNLDAVRDVQAVQTTGQADVVVSEVSQPGNGKVAWTQCASNAQYGGTDPNRWCYPQLLKYNTGGYSSDFNTDNKSKSIACHELGHTMGLRHAKNNGDDPDWANSCMRDFAVGARPDVLFDYTSHDQSHLNSHY